MATKRKRIILSDSARKKARAVQRNIIQSTRIVLKNQYQRWNDVREANHLKTNEETAKLLLDCYYSRKTKTSTPLVGSEFNFQVSPVQDSQTETASSTISGIAVLRTPSTLEKTIGYEHPHEQPGPSGESFKDADGSSSSTSPAKDGKDVSWNPGFMDSDSSLTDEEIEHSGEESNLLEITVDEEIMAVGTDESDHDSDEEEMPEEPRHTDPGVIQVMTSEDVLLDTCSIAFTTSLKILAENSPRHPCGECNMPFHIQEEKKGTAIYFTWICPNQHTGYRWCSQPRLKSRGVPAGDFMIAVNTLLSGNNFNKIALLLRFCNLGNIQKAFYDSVQALHCCTVIDQYWEECLQTVHDSLRGQSLVVAGDGRNDSPGHSAKYCTYTLMEVDTKNIVSMVVVDKRQVALKSTNMEKFGFIKSMQKLKDDGFEIKEVVTDASVQISSLMKKEFPEIKHSWDVWHGSKNFGKKLNAAAGEKKSRDLAPWVKDVIRHFWFCSEQCHGSRDTFVAMWRGVLHHVVNNHEWALGDGGGPGGCQHAALDERDKEWLERDSAAHVKLRELVLDKRLLNNIHHYVNFRHTGTLETFHNHILMYASKRFAFRYQVYKARNQLAAIDYQKHKDRLVKKDGTGADRYRRMYSKRSGNWFVVPVKEDKRYLYVSEIQGRILDSCIQDRQPLRRKRPLPEDDPRRLQPTIAPKTPPPTKDLMAKQQSRFAGPEVTESS